MHCWLEFGRVQTVHNATSRRGEWGNTAPEPELKVRYFDVAKVGGLLILQRGPEVTVISFVAHHCSSVVFALCCHKDNFLK